MKLTGNRIINTGVRVMKGHAIWLLLFTVIISQSLCGNITIAVTELDKPVAIETKPQFSINDLLDKVEQAGNRLQSFQAKMIYEQVQKVTNTKIVRNGAMSYKTDQNSILARIHFADHQQFDLDDDEKPKPARFNEDYVFDGQWITRRNERTQTVQKWEVAKKEWTRDSFRLGKGPFPLPFAIRKMDVLDHFDVKLIPPIAELEKLYPAIVDSDHLQLTPKPESSYAKEYISMDIWISKKNSLPSQISYSNKEFEMTTVSWEQIELDKILKPATFEIEKTGVGWTEEVHPMEEKPAQ